MITTKHLCQLAMALTGKSQSEIARSIEVTPGTISAILDGRTKKSHQPTQLGLRVLIMLALSEVVPKDNMTRDRWNEIMMFAAHLFWPNDTMEGTIPTEEQMMQWYPRCTQYLINYNMRCMRHGKYSHAAYLQFLAEVK